MNFDIVSNIFMQCGLCLSLCWIGHAKAMTMIGCKLFFSVILGVFGELNYLSGALSLLSCLVDRGCHGCHMRYYFMRAIK